ncbi:ATP synthase subunit delta, chloroplastic [Dendrobium catenatum]|uniref:ATP synthase delta chain, chloroplastic n=1 Tax=Dendrobium catenatum TaxID=906689 RepID=A0A2I0W724_9ASPA|nr:ATP synthase subunit delta, chloroplastic [Dendrobium catenatum]XP_020695183.1 ATP synthase subunit delta, chloroplastic [Dendrobium catenatum]XP_028553947.1 ATP synthase subunit delta, chloroplastic [Dendrobium catenatum]XP_028553948.1 ATP synthase subunit delta, chloroplastic [Dendrobium catenatum]XP_028553949.1 ATP synthase subunit delta, chloroplastic [Dendrobium catenatum]XP_028553950.1 ATP synthase subunit delta, chloroplastic [Dendrobium catenatum]PKU71464.1 ATP synthase delta chain
MATIRLSPAAIHTFAVSPTTQIPPISSSLRPSPFPLHRRRFSSLKISIPRRRHAGGGSAAGATMSDTPASRYASALAEVAKSNNTLDATMGDLENIETVFSNSSVLSFFINPTISDEKKLDFIKEIATASELQLHTANFLNILIDMKRIDVIIEIVKEFSFCYNEITGTEVAVVSSVVQLESQHLAQIAKTVQRLTGAKNVRVKTAIDPSLVAGFTIRYGNSGSKLIDMSVKKQLDEIAAQLDFSNIVIA